MSSSLVRNPQASVTLCCRKWLLHRCMHLSSAQASTSEPIPLTDSENEPASPRSQRQSKKAKSIIEAPRNRVSLHLEKIRENPFKSEDIEAQRPSEKASPLSETYEEEYRSVIESLDRAFTVKQMHDFLATNNIPLPRRKTKLSLASQILEQKWGWETLESFLQRKVDWSQVVEEQFPLGQVEAFLLMGKDGTGALQLSRRYQSQVNFILDPMSVKVTGLMGSVKNIGLYLESFKADIEVENFSLPPDTGAQVNTGIISRLSGAYVKMINDSEVSISFLKSLPDAANIAKRLVLQAATKGVEQCIRAVHLPRQSEAFDTPQYSLFPFSPETSLPWQKSSTTTFRYRQVGQNFMKSSVAIASNSSENSEDFGNAFLADNSQCDIKEQLLSQMPVNEFSNGSLTFTASSGQVLFTSSSNQQSTLLPPISGQVGPDAIFSWIEDKPSQTMFHPSAPLEISSAPAHQVHNTRRLLYRTSNLRQEPDPDAVTNHPTFQKTIELEIPIPDTTTDDFTALGLLECASCVKSTERYLDLMIPDRQADIRISALYTENIPFDAWPEELKNVELHPTESENTEDNIPLMIKLDDTTYFLHNDDHVQHSFKTITPKGSNSTAYNVMMESSIDHATGNRQTVCKMKTVCQDYATASGWNDFLKSWGCLSSPRSQRATPDPFKPTSFF